MRLSVQDVGVGLNRQTEDTERLFQAFYTTKQKRHGHRPIRESLDHRKPPGPACGASTQRRPRRDVCVLDSVRVPSAAGRAPHHRLRSIRSSNGFGVTCHV